MPVETIFGRCGVGWCITEVLDDRAGSFVPSYGFDLEEEGLVTFAEAIFVGLAVGAGSVVLIGKPKASSASASVTLLFKGSGTGSALGGGAKSNFAPLSWSNENSSKDGKRAASSSAAALRTCTFWESSAAKGSEDAPLMGEGLGFGATACVTGTVGLPRLIGVISGITWTCCTGATFWIPMIGGEATCGSGDGSCSFLRLSDWVRLE